MKPHTQIILVLTILFALFQLIEFPHGNATFLVGFSIVCGGLLWGAVSLGLVARRQQKPKALPADFSSSYRSKNIALDLEHDQLWVRPVRGKERVLYRGQLRKWQHEWTNVYNKVGHAFRRKNLITFRINDLDTPTFQVAFKTYEDAEIWQARISAWVNE